jgi:hypothetical protein
MTQVSLKQLPGYWWHLKAPTANEMVKHSFTFEWPLTVKEVRISASCYIKNT